jgi:hypothetical protein
LKILDLSLNKVNIKDVSYKFSKLDKKRNTIGDYILVNKSFKNIIKLRK